MTNTPIIVEPQTKATACVIWLHGLGADGNDFVPVIDQVSPQEHAIRFIFPHAPVRPVSLNGGLPMRAWYDLYGLDIDSPQDSQGMRETEQWLMQLIEAQIQQGINSERIFLAGFSQGGAMILHTGLRYDKPLAGIIALSCYLPLHDVLASETHTANQQTPIFMAHGERDDVLSMDIGQHSCGYLRDSGHPVDWQVYPMGHEVCLAELGDIRRFIAGRL